MAAGVVVLATGQEEMGPHWLLQANKSYLWQGHLGKLPSTTAGYLNVEPSLMLPATEEPVTAVLFSENSGGGGWDLDLLDLVLPRLNLLLPRLSLRFPVLTLAFIAKANSQIPSALLSIAKSNSSIAKPSSQIPSAELSIVNTYLV